MTKTSLQLPRACSHCELPAVVHVITPADRHSRFLCPTHVISIETALGPPRQIHTSSGPITTGLGIDEIAVEYPDPLTIPVVRAEDDDMADWEPCQGVSYPDGYYSGPYPCEDLAEPGEALCTHCRNAR